MIYSRNSLYFQVIFMECLTEILKLRKRCAKESGLEIGWRDAWNELTED